MAADALARLRPSGREEVAIPIAQRTPNLPTHPRHMAGRGGMPSSLWACFWGPKYQPT